MIRLALISSTLTADTYGALSTRLHRAAWTAYAPVDSGGSGQALGQVTEAASAEELFADRVDAFDAVVIDADQVTAERLAKAAWALGKPLLAGAVGGNIRALGQADTLLMPAHPWRFLPDGPVHLMSQKQPVPVAGGYLGESDFGSNLCC